MKRLDITSIASFDHAADATRQRKREWAKQKRANAGAKRGRPSLNLSPEEQRARRNAQAAVRMRQMRLLRKKASTQHRSKEECDVDGTKRNAIEPPGIDYAAFGIIAVVVMRGTDVISAWRRL